MIPDPSTILVIHAAATWAMAGVIWFIQLVHYPAYRQVTADFAAFQFRSPARTGLVVGPLMFTELATGLLLLWRQPPALAAASLWAGAVLIATCWASTLLLQVPIHLRLTIKRDDKTIARLLRTNWIRTLVWTMRAILVAEWLATSLQR